MIAWSDRWMKENASVALEPYVGRSIDLVVIGGRPLSTSSNGIQVTQGDRIDLTRWIKSSRGNGAPPEILLCSTNQEVGEFSFPASMVPRTDVALNENNPLLMQSCLSASVLIPKSQPAGEYNLKIIEHDKSRL